MTVYPPSDKSSLERNVAWRVQREREQRGWTYEGLAKRVSAAGCPMHASTPFKIEKGKPPRKVTIPELVALADVFGLTVQEMLTPQQVVEEQEIRDLMDRYREVVGTVNEPLRELSDIVAELSKRLGGVEKATAALLDYVTGAVLDPQLLVGREESEAGNGRG